MGCHKENLLTFQVFLYEAYNKYQQRTKDINKTVTESLLTLSRALGCRMEDLMEFNGI